MKLVVDPENQEKFRLAATQVAQIATGSGLGFQAKMFVALGVDEMLLGSSLRSRRKRQRCKVVKIALRQMLLRSLIDAGLRVEG